MEGAFSSENVEDYGTIEWMTPIPAFERHAYIFMDYFYDTGRGKTLWLYPSKHCVNRDTSDGAFYVSARYKISITGCFAYRMVDEAYRLSETWKIENNEATAIMSPSLWLEQLKRDEPYGYWDGMKHYIVCTGNEIFEFLTAHEPTVEAFSMPLPWMSVKEYKPSEAPPN